MSVKPEVILLDQLLREIARGDLRVPRFQRPFVWRPEQMLDLFDSIERGYPIGSLLVWDTDEQIPTVDSIGGLELPEASGSVTSYVLDGHQRLSTLFGVLMRPANSPRSSDQAEWMWWVYRTLGLDAAEAANPFRHWKSARTPPNSYLPLRATLRTMDFLAYARSVEAEGIFSPEELIDEAEQVAQRIKSYRLSVVRLVGGSLNDAVEVFSRLNSRGQAMTPDQMVSALSYRGEKSDTLAEKIDRISENLATREFGEIASVTIFRSILAVAGEEDVQEARWDSLARRLYSRLDDAAEDTEAALYRAVEFLQDEVRVPLARLVPYNAQLMLLAAFFSIDRHPNVEKRRQLNRWFWATSWSGWFAGANSTQIKNALLDMRYFAERSPFLALPPEAERARGFPNRFDMRSARVRSLLAWDLQRFPNPTDTFGNEVDRVSALQIEDTRAYRHIVTRSIPNGSSPANRIVLPTPPGYSVRRSLLNLTDAERRVVLESNGIPESALSALESGDDYGFIENRARFLASEERQFMRQWDVILPAKEWDSGEIDTE